ncbi:MAG: nuclear transport factor 2 family protein [Nocardioidaceae bacterium]|nr:nuclear transport factor 2 family protein [Nocardioidaceae bacterium]
MSALTLDRLVALEHDGWRSLCESRGGTFYGAVMTADAVMILVNGMVLDRDTTAASLNDAPPWESFEILDPRLIELGEQAGALVYRARAVRGDDQPFVALMTSTYRLVDGEPRLALYQQTTITH